MADSRILVWIFVIIHTVLSAKVRMPDSGIETRKLSIPQAPSRSRQTVEGNFQSYSIEFSYMLDYAGNDSYAAHVMDMWQPLTLTYQQLTKYILQ